MSGITEVQRKRNLDGKLKTDIFSSDIDCMISKVQFMEIRNALAREKREKKCEELL